MTRKKRLSRPARASSRLPLSPTQTQVRLKPLLLILRPIPPSGGLPSRARRLAFTSHRFRRKAAHQQARRLASAPFQSTPPLMLARARAQSRFAGCCLDPTARLQSKSAVCGLNGFLPTLRVGALHLNPQPLFKRSCSSASLRRAQTSTAFPFWKQKLRLSSFFSPKRNPKDSGERRGNKGQWPNRDGDGHSTKQETLITYYNEHQSHHHQW
jgi:hypothetical protein